MRVIRFEELQKLYSQPTDTLYIVNFWATWCRPCVAELPNFERAHRYYQNKKVKIVLVSMDFAKDLKSKVQPFITKKQLKNPVVLLNEMDGNQFIDQVDTSWTGAIPATLLVNTRRQKRKFFEKELTYDQLVQEINGLL
ncbi:MAG: TlpA disulfide reductase family protein [Spirosomataceae bacterium]